MELTNSFQLKLPIDEAWAVLTDIERIAPCMPGTQLEEVEGDEYRGTIKVKVGPVTTRYQGSARIKELDDKTHHAVIEADGSEIGGQGSAGATISATLTDNGDLTDIEMSTDLRITGKVAQFGHGMISDVSSRLLDQFVDNLESGHHHKTARGAQQTTETSRQTPGTTDAEEQPQPTTAARAIDHPEAESIDLLDIARAPLAKRLAPTLALAVVAILMWRWWHRR